MRRDGLHVLADWAENIVIAPAYARQSQYWASVLSAPVIPDFAEWEMRDAREFEFEPEAEAELPEADLPVLRDIFLDYPAVVCLNTNTISAPPACSPTRANTELRPNEPALRGGTRVHFVLNGT